MKNEFLNIFSSMIDASKVYAVDYIFTEYDIYVIKSCRELIAHNYDNIKNNQCNISPFISETYVRMSFVGYLIRYGFVRGLAQVIPHIPKQYIVYFINYDKQESFLYCGGECVKLINDFSIIHQLDRELWIKYCCERFGNNLKIIL